MWRSVLLPVLLLVVHAAEARPARQVTWTGISEFTGRKITVMMPEGVAVTGKAINVDSEALVLQVAHTADAARYPKGELRIPRDNLRAFEVHTSTKRWRVIGTALGFVAGLGLAAAIEFSGGLFASGSAGRDAAAIASLGGSTVGGYFLGRAADRGSTTVIVIR